MVALLIVLVALVVGLVVFTPNEAAAHPKGRPDVPSYAHIHEPWGCHAHHYEDSMLLDDHAGMPALLHMGREAAIPFVRTAHT